MQPEPTWKPQWDWKTEGEAPQAELLNTSVDNKKTASNNVSNRWDEILDIFGDEQ